MPVFKQNIQGRSKTVQRPSAPIYDIGAMVQQQSKNDNTQRKLAAIKVNTDRYKKESDYAGSFKGLATNFVKGLPKAANDVVAGNIIRLFGSAAQVPFDVKNDKFSDKKMEWMKYLGQTPQQTFQHKIGQTRDEIIDGTKFGPEGKTKGLGSLAWDVAQVPLAGMEAIAGLNGISKGVNAFKGTTGVWKGTKAAVPEIVDGFIPTTRGLKGKVAEAPQVSTEVKLKRELAALQQQKLNDALQTERPRSQGYQSGIKFKATPVSTTVTPKPSKIETPIQIPKGKTVYRGTLGTGEIENILKGNTTYIEGQQGGLWAKTSDEAMNYAKGHSAALGSMTRKPKGEGAFLLEGKMDKNGITIPVRAKNIKTGETIDLLNTKAPSPIQTGEIPQFDTKGEITTPKVKYKQVIEQNLGIRDKTHFTPGVSGQITKIEKQLANPDKLMVGDIAKDTPLETDIGNYGKGMKDVYSNFKKAFGDNYEQVKKAILDPFDKSKGDFIDTQNKWLGELKTKVVDNMGFAKGSEKSADLQKFGEGILTSQEIVAKYGKGELGNFIHANNWFRKSYKQLLDDVNGTLAKIYPGQPDKLIPERQDYYRHFKEMAEGLSGLKNIFDSPAGISSSLAGVSRMTKPNQKWWGAAQRRLGNETDYDATGGFLEYLKGATYKQHIEPHIANFRNLQTGIADNIAGTPREKELNNFQQYLTMFANDLAGKTNPIDTLVADFIPGGRKTLAVLGWANNRVKADAILGNLSSAVAQVFAIPMGLSKAGIRYAPVGIKSTLEGIFNANDAMKSSSFLKERYFKGYNKFDKGILDNAKNFAAWMISIGDEGGTKLIWNTFHAKALEEGVSNAVKYADDMTREMVAGRGIGEVPLAQKAKIFQMIAPFQLEVQQLWHNMNGMVKEKEFGKLATFFILNHLFNKGAEQIRGSGVSFDPIQAGIDAYGISQDEKDNKGWRMAGRLGGELAGNVVGGQTAAGLYPEYGAFGAPSRKEVFGKEDPSRFGTGPLFAKALTDPYAIIPPFGGQQFKKTIQGGEAFLQGYGTNKRGEVTYPIEQNAQNAVRNFAFGQYSTPEARNYFEQNQRALTPEQSQLFKDLPQEQQSPFYQEVNKLRDAETKQTQFRNTMESDMRQAIQSNNNDAIAEIIKREPTYGLDLLKRLYKEIGLSQSGIENRKAISDYEMMLKNAKLNNFYTK